MKKMLKKSKGFTLVELLIVIIIIGILAGMMMLATGSATDKAEATKIVSNLRNVKAAAVMYYADYNKWPVKISQDEVNKYLDQSLVVASAAAGKYIIESTDKGVVARYTLKDSDKGGIKDKLDALKANSAISVDSTNVDMPINQK